MYSISKKFLSFLTIVLFSSLLLGTSFNRSVAAQEVVAPIDSTVISIDPNHLDPSIQNILLNSLDPNYEWIFSDERAGTIRPLIDRVEGGVRGSGEKFENMPESLSFSVSTDAAGTKTMFVSATLGKIGDSKKGPNTVFTHQAGLLIQAKINPDNNRFEIVSYREFPECEELPSVQSSRNGDVIAVLCKTFSHHHPSKGEEARSDYDADLIQKYNDTYGGSDVILHDRTKYEMWLYEWRASDTADGQIDIENDDPLKFVVHKSVGKNDGLPHTLVYGEEDNSYGISVVGAWKGGGHTGDTFFVVERAEDAAAYEIAKMKQTSDSPQEKVRGWKSTCGPAHAFLIVTGFNPITREYTVICSGDTNTDPAVGNEFSGINFATATSQNGVKNIKESFLILQKEGNYRLKGDPGALHPFGRGWVGAVVGASGQQADMAGRASNPVTRVGIVQFNQAGEMISNPVTAGSDPNAIGQGIHWIDVPAAEYADHYVSYPQLVPLGQSCATDGATLCERYLLGYGIMLAEGKAGTDLGHLRWQLTYPMKYYVQEIEITCSAADTECQNPISISSATDPQPLPESVGWGMIDRMVSLGNGQVGWATYEMSSMTLAANADKWHQPQGQIKALQLNVYTSPNR